MSLVRRSVPNDNSCLFYALGYACEGVEPSSAVEQRLRKIVGDDALADPDPDTRALYLDKPVAEYAQWIQNTMHWGGENEILTLSKHYNTEVAVVSCESMSVMVYNEGMDRVGRVFLLYTGQHYDPLVGAESPDTPTADEVKVFSPGTDLRDAALAIATTHNADAAKRAKQKRVTRLKCDGCGELLADNAAFQEHCGVVEHDDDFCYTCTEVEVVIEEGEDLPEGSIDLTDESKYYTFYNSADYPFSNFYPATVEVGGTVYKTGEHCWQASKYMETEPSLAAKITAVETVDEAHTISHTEGIDKHRPDWDEVKYGVLLNILRAKFDQHPGLASQLVETDGRELVNVDTDSWAGMSAAGGIATGHNNVGKALMEVRTELLAKK